MENGLLERTLSGEQTEAASAENPAVAAEAAAATATAQPEAPQETKESAAPVDAVPEAAPDGSIGERDRELLDALDIMFSRKDATPVKLKPAPPKNEKPTVRKFGWGVVQKGAGIVSLSLILMLMGVVMLICLFSPSPDYMLPLKLSPVAAILLGIELLVHYLMSGRNFRVHTLSIIFCAAVVAGSCFMAVSLDKSYRETRTEYDNRSIAAEIYDSSYKELKYVADIAQIDVTVDINPGGKSSEKGMSGLSADDYVGIAVELSGSYSSAVDFAEECKSIIDGYRLMRIPVTDYSFISEDRFNSFRMEIKGSFMQDFSISELAEKVHHVYIDDYDYISDLDDFTGETTEAGSATAEG